MLKRARELNAFGRVLEGVDTTGAILSFLDVASMANLEGAVGITPSLRAAYRAYPYELGVLLRKTGDIFAWVQARDIVCTALDVASWYETSCILGGGLRCLVIGLRCLVGGLRCFGGGLIDVLL
jgi:hypothetical protein